MSVCSAFSTTANVGDAMEATDNKISTLEGELLNLDESGSWSLCFEVESLYRVNFCIAYPKPR